MAVFTHQLYQKWRNNQNEGTAHTLSISVCSMIFQAGLIACGQQTTSQPLTKSWNLLLGVVVAPVMAVKRLHYACTSCHAGKCWTWHLMARNSPQILKHLAGCSRDLLHQCHHHYHHLHQLCYVRAERSARLEQEGYDQVTLPFVTWVSASGTQWEHLDYDNKGDTWWRGRGRFPRCTRCFGGSVGSAQYSSIDTRTQT